MRRIFQERVISTLVACSAIPLIIWAIVSILGYQPRPVWVMVLVPVAFVFAVVLGQRLADPVESLSIQVSDVVSELRNAPSAQDPSEAPDRISQDFRSLAARVRTVSSELNEALRKLEEQGCELKESRRFSRYIVDGIPSLVAFGPDGIARTVNTEARGLFGLDENAVGCHYRETFPGHRYGPIREAIREAMQTGNPVRIDAMEVQQENNDIMVLGANIFPFVNEEGELAGVGLTAHDITSKHHLEAMEDQLVQAERFATLGTMLAGVAHEIRNPLSAISGHVQLLLEKEKGKLALEAREGLEIMDECVQHIAEIVGKLLRLAQRRSFKPMLHDLNELADEAVSHVDYQNMFDDIEVERRYSPKVPVYCDNSRIIQVLINVLLNASDAMKGRGRLVLETEYADQSSVIHITDHGTGISPENLKRIFDPFYTTKEPGTGTGLGLSIAYRIVEQHHGSIHVGSEPGRTTVSIALPAGSMELAFVEAKGAVIS